MRWSLINDVAGKKYDSTFEAIQFFANLKSKDYAVKFLNILLDNVYLLQEDTQMLLVDPKLDFVEVCPAAFSDYLMVCQGKAILELEKTIPQHIKNDLSDKEISSIIQDLYQQQNFDFWSLSKPKREAMMKSTIWCYDDEVLAIQTAIKAVMMELVAYNIHMQSENGFISVSAVAKFLEEMIEAQKESSMPTRMEEAPEMTEETLDLISSSLWEGEDKYVGLIIDYILK